MSVIAKVRAVGFVLTALIFGLLWVSGLMELPTVIGGTIGAAIVFFFIMPNTNRSY